MSTLLDLVNRVLRRTGQVEVTTLVNADTPVTQAVDFLNETYTEMLQRLKVNRLQRQATFTTTPGTSAYTLDSTADINALLPDSVLEAGQQARLSEVDYTYPLAHGPNASGRPLVFYRRENQLHLYPTPDAAYTVQYQYGLKPVPLSEDTDTTDLPAEWEAVLINGTQARLEKFLGEPAQESFFLYRDGLAQLKAQAPQKPHSRMRGFYRGGQSR